MKYTPLLSLLVVAHLSTSQTPCEDGLAGGIYPCNQVTLLAHMEPSDVLATEQGGFWLNDIWGWTDPETNKEYALLGLIDGVSFVEVTTPTDPKLLGKLPEPTSSNNRVAEIQHGKSTWRDIKVYQNHAFIVSDVNGSHGMQVFDLTKLRGLDGSNVLTFSHDFHYRGFGSAHNIVINEQTGYAYAVGISAGGESCSGGLHIVDINTPKSPEFVGCFSADGYTHDAQCVTYQGSDTDYVNQEICFNANEDTFTIVNLEDKEDPLMISRTGYQKAVYSHQGWLSEDHRFYLMNDELDEKTFGFNAKTLIWDIADLDAPILIGEYYNNAQAIDHNLYTHNGLIFESNYLSGLRVLDMGDITDGKLRERAYFDTYPDGDGIHFGGTWSNYPFFSSGTIIVSDMNSGLFVLKLDLQADQIVTHPSDQEDCSGNGYTFEISTADSDNAFQWQKFDGMGYVDLVETDQLIGVTTDSLTVIPSESLDGQRFRCKVTDKSGAEHYSFLAGYAPGNYPPVADFEVVQTLSTDGFSIAFENNSLRAESYLWEFGDGTTSTEASPAHTFADGTYEITLTVYNDCGVDSKTLTQLLITGIDPDTRELAVYPNPTRNKFINVYSADRGILTIMDLSGKQVFTMDKSKGAEVYQLRKLKKGSYLLVFENAKGQMTRRLLIE